MTRAGTPLDFSDASTRLADLNGDGLLDVVQLSPQRVVYWPGASSTRGRVVGLPERTADRVSSPLAPETAAPLRSSSRCSSPVWLAAKVTSSSGLGAEVTRRTRDSRERARRALPEAPQEAVERMG